MAARRLPRAQTTDRAELALIEHIRQRASRRRSPQVRVGIGDDCAILKPRPGEEIVVTTDLSLEGRHFRREWHSPASIGHRALARGLSDIAAMGARPIAAFLSLALSPAIARDKRWLDGFLDGLLGLAQQAGVPLAGGDTSESPDNFILSDIVLLGAAPAGKALRRCGAKPGDALYCTGALGGADAELHALEADSAAFRAAKADGTHPHLFPQPRLRTGRLLLARNLATACIDLSDGLSTDLAHLCKASHVAAELDASLLPLHALTTPQQPDRRVDAALHGGEDYELLFTAPASVPIPRRLGGIPITRIGSVVQIRRGKAPVTLVDLAGRRAPLKPAGWEHFRP